ncbi:hypothetical protein MRX96_055532 [Rhipicephalus microplus]
MNRGPRRDFDWDYMDQLFPPRLSEEYGAFHQPNREGAGREEGDSGRHPLFKAPVKVAPDREDDVSRRLKETLGEVGKALWLFSNYHDHVYGIAGTKAAPPTPTPPTVGEPANGSSSTFSVQNGSATGCHEDPIPNPKPTCLPALRVASSTASTTNPLLEPSSQELPKGFDIRQPTSHAPSEDVNNENSFVSAQKQSSVDSSFLALHTDTKHPEAESTKFSLTPKSQGLPNRLVARQPAAHAPCEDVNKDNSSISAQKQSSANSLLLTVHTETKDIETGSTKFSLVPKSQGLTSGRVARPSTSRSPSNDANKENNSASAQHESPSSSSSLMVHKEPRDAEAGSTKFSSVPKSQGLPRGLAVRPPITRAPSKGANKASISGSAQHHSYTNYSSLMVHKETKSTEAGTTKFSSLPKSQEIPSGLVVRPPTARAPCEDVNKETSFVLAQKQLSADYSSVGKHTETEDSEADRTWFSSVPKGQGLPSGLVVRPPTGRAPFKDVTKENSSVLAQKQSSADFLPLMVHTETNDPKADRMKISLVPKIQGISSILVTPAPTAGAPLMNANKENHFASAQHESYTSKSSPTVHSQRKSPEPGSTECSSMSTSSASFGQSGVSRSYLMNNVPTFVCVLRDGQRVALAYIRSPSVQPFESRRERLGPFACMVWVEEIQENVPPLMSPVKVLPGQEDKLSRRVQDALGDVNVALWLFANHRDHLYGLAGNKVAQQTRAPPPAGKPVNGTSSTSSMRNDNAMDPGGTRSSSSNRSSSLSREQQHSNRASSSGCHVSSGGSTHPASQSGTRNQQQSSAYGASSSHFSRHDSSLHSQSHHPRQQQLHPPQSLMDGQYKPSNAYSSSATGSKNSRHSAQPLRGSWLQPHQSRGSSSKQDPGETRSSSSNRSSSLSTDQRYSNHVSSSGRSVHAASHPSTRNQLQSSSYNPSSSHLSRHDSSHHTGNHHTKQQLPHHPQLQTGGQYKPSPTCSSSSAASKNSRLASECNIKSQEKTFAIFKCGLECSLHHEFPVPSSSQEPRNDLGVPPPAKRARRL